MSKLGLYIIDYNFHGAPKSFIIRRETMNSSEAWLWASCDAGVAFIPKPGRRPFKPFTKPMAEKLGVTDVQWKEAASVAWDEDQYK